MTHKRHDIEIDAPVARRTFASRRERGVAMVLVMGAVAVALVLGLSFLAAQSTALGITTNLQGHERARMIAESGLTTALTYVQHDEAWRTAQPHGVWVQDHPFAGGTFTIAGYDGQDASGDGAFDGDGDLSNDAAHLLTLIVTGNYQGMSHTARAVVTPQPGDDGEHGSAGLYTLALSHSLDMSNNASIDSFDSAKGPYGGDNRGSDAVLVVDTGAKNRIKLANNSNFNGHVLVGVDATPTDVISDPKNRITSVGTLSESLPFPDVAPWPTDVGSSQDTKTYSSFTTLDHNIHHENMTVAINGLLRIEGHVVIRVDKKFELSNNATIEILTDSSLTLYVGEEITIRNNAQVNVNTGDPSKLTIYSLASDATHQIFNNAQMYAIIDAPLSSLSLKPNADLYGAFMGKSLDLSNNAGMHIDVRAQMPRLGGGSGEESGADSYAVRWLGQQ